MACLCLSFDIHLFEIEKLSFLTLGFQKRGFILTRFSLLILTRLAGLVKRRTTRVALQFGSELVSRHEEGAAMYGRAGLSIGSANRPSHQPLARAIVRSHLVAKVRKVRRPVHT